MFAVSKQPLLFDYEKSDIYSGENVANVGVSPTVSKV